MNFLRAWILFCTFLVAGGWGLSVIGQLNEVGNWGLLAIPTLFVLSSPQFRSRRRPRFSRWKKPLPFLYLVIAAMALIGGLLYAPTNYDGITYRVPRVLHWLAEGRWHWIGGWNGRMDYSALGYEWLMSPFLTLTWSDRLLFLPNLISFLLLPGAVFLAFRTLGVPGKVARFWMWTLPAAYGIALQAGSIGNDSFAIVFLLAAIGFGGRARRTESTGDLWIAILAMALLTGSKASNLPLLLPCLIVVAPALRMMWRNSETVLTSIGVVVVGLVVSFLPLAVINAHYTGDWTGDPRNEGKMKLSSPAHGLVGNALQLIQKNLEPPVLPGAAGVNIKIKHLMQSAPLQTISSHYPRFTLGVNDLAGEEASGLGLGLALIGIIFWTVALVHPAGWITVWQKGSTRPGLLVGLAGWIAIGVLMAKLGSEALPRIAIPYYPLLLVLPSLHPGARWLLNQKGWRVTFFLAAASVFPALILSPGRPLFPVGMVTNLLHNRFPGNQMVDRVLTVYSVYAKRSDPYAEVREQLPAGERIIGFAGTGDESEISFWRPFGDRIVQDFVPNSEKTVPSTNGLDAIVTSDWGCRDRFGLSPEELSNTVGWKLDKTILIRDKAGSEPREWSILVPH